MRLLLHWLCPFVEHDSWQNGESEGLGAKQLLSTGFALCLVGVDLRMHLFTEVIWRHWRHFCIWDQAPHL